MAVGAGGGGREAGGMFPGFRESCGAWSRPPQPSERRWARVHDQIETSLRPVAATAASAWRPWQNRWFRRGVFATLVAAVPAVSAAAMLLISAMSQGPTSSGVGHAGDMEAPGDVLSIVGPGDVEIVSIRPADAGHLVVGQPPASEDLQLVAAGDIQLDSVLPAEDGEIPQVTMGG